MANVDTQIASTILTQLGGAGRLRMFTGAYNFVALDNGVVFRIKNARANVIKITLNGLDLYDLEVGRMRGTTYKVVLREENVYNDMLKPMIEKATGMYLSFEKGGAIKNRVVKQLEDAERIVHYRLLNDGGAKRMHEEVKKIVNKYGSAESKKTLASLGNRNWRDYSLNEPIGDKKLGEVLSNLKYSLKNDISKSSNKKMAKGGGVGDDDNFQFVVIVHSDLGDNTYTITATDGVQAVHEAKYLFKKENPQYKGSISTSVLDKYAKGGYMAKGGKTYAIIYFSDKKPIARRYNSSYKAFSDYESQGSVYAELYDSRGIFISAYPKGGKEKAKYVKGGYMAKGGNIQYYVAVGETKDGYWSVMSRPTYSKKIAKMLSESVPKGEVGKVVTLEEARKHKKLIGEQYLSDEMLAKPSTYDPPSNLDHKKMAKGGKTKLVDISDNDSRAYSEKYEVHLNDKIVGRVYKLINGKHKALNSGWENKFPEKEFDNKKDAVDYVKQQVSKMAKGGKMDRIKNWMLKGVSVGKKVGKKAYEGGKSLAKKGIEKGIEKSKQAVKEGKRKIALQVIDATKDKVATNQKVHLKASEKLVRNKYAKGGGVGSSNSWNYTIGGL